MLDKVNGHGQALAWMFECYPPTFVDVPPSNFIGELHSYAIWILSISLSFEDLTATDSL